MSLEKLLKIEKKNNIVRFKTFFKKIESEKQIF